MRLTPVGLWAFGRVLPGLPDGGSVLGADLTQADRRRLSTLLARRGADHLGGPDR